MQTNETQRRCKSLCNQDNIRKKYIEIHTQTLKNNNISNVISQFDKKHKEKDRIKNIIEIKMLTLYAWKVKEEGENK